MVSQALGTAPLVTNEKGNSRPGLPRVEGFPGLRLWVPKLDSALVPSKLAGIVLPYTREGAQSEPGRHRLSDEVALPPCQDRMAAVFACRPAELRPLFVK